MSHSIILSMIKLHDVYALPIYAPDEGPPKILKEYFKSWIEFVAAGWVLLSLIGLIAALAAKNWIVVDLYKGPFTRVLKFEFGMWKRCKTDLGVLAPIAECSSWEQFMPTEFTNANDLHVNISCDIGAIIKNKEADTETKVISILYDEILMARRMMGWAIILMSVALPPFFTTFIHRNTLWNISGCLISISSIFISASCALMISLPYQHKIRSNFENSGILPEPTPDPPTSTTTGTTPNTTTIVTTTTTTTSTTTTTTNITTPEAEESQIYNQAVSYEVQIEWAPIFAIIISFIMICFTTAAIL